MILTEHSSNDGTPYGHDASSSMIRDTKTMAQEGYAYQTNSETRESLSTTVDLSQTQADADRLIESTIVGATSAEIYGSQRDKSRCEIRGKQVWSAIKGAYCRWRTSWSKQSADFAERMLIGFYGKVCRARKFLTGTASAEEPVFDIVNAGPNHRFATATRIAHNCLGLGFGMGAEKFQKTVKLWTGKDISLTEAKRVVDKYRESNPRIVALWRGLNSDIQRFHIDKQCKFNLPSGRTIEYFDVRKDPDAGWVGRVERGDYFKKLFAGIAAENCTQGCARDIFADRMLALDDAGLPCVLHAHDEVVLEVPEDRAEEAKAETERIMSTAPEWMPGLPLACEAKIADRYMK